MERDGIKDLWLLLTLRGNCSICNRNVYQEVLVVNAMQVGKLSGRNTAFLSNRFVGCKQHQADHQQATNSFVALIRFEKGLHNAFSLDYLCDTTVAEDFLFLSPRTVLLKES